MVQVVDTKAGLGAYLGQGFASGVEKGMERQSKLQEMMAEQTLKSNFKMKEALTFMDMIKKHSSGATTEEPSSPTVTEGSESGATPSVDNSATRGPTPTGRVWTPEKLTMAKALGYGDIASELFKDENKRITHSEDVARDDKKFFHNESAPYAKTVSDDAKEADEQIQASNRVIEAVSKEDYSPIRGVIVDFLNDKLPGLGNVLQTGDQAKIKASFQEYLHGKKSLMGTRISDTDFKALQAMWADPTRTKEANIFFANLMKKHAQRALLRRDAAEEVQGNSDYRPARFEQKVETIFRKKLDHALRQEYMQKAGNNKELAKKLAAEDGYTNI